MPNIDRACRTRGHAGRFAALLRKPSASPPGAWKARIVTPLAEGDSMWAGIGLRRCPREPAGPMSGQAGWATTIKYRHVVASLQLPGPCPNRIALSGRTGSLRNSVTWPDVKELPCETATEPDQDVFSVRANVLLSNSATLLKPPAGTDATNLEGGAKTQERN